MKFSLIILFILGCLVFRYYYVNRILKELKQHLFIAIYLMVTISVIVFVLHKMYNL